VRSLSNCVAARRGGEQRMTTRQTIMTSEHDSATAAATSLLEIGDVWGAHAPQPPRANTDAQRVPVGVVGDSMSGKESTCEDGRPAGAGREVTVARYARRARPAGVRAAVGAGKRGNACGAKGGREAEVAADCGSETIRYRLPIRARTPEAQVPAPAFQTLTCVNHRKGEAGGRSWITRHRGARPRREENCQPESRMREIRTYGSEGGAAQTNASSLPLSFICREGTQRTQKIIESLAMCRSPSEQAFIICG
jgi:hypothetical protein